MRGAWSASMVGWLLAGCGGQVLGRSDPGAGVAGSGRAVAAPEAGGATGIIDHGTGGEIGADASMAPLCGGYNGRAEILPQDFYIVLDASVSMGESHVAKGLSDWAVARQALETFAQNPASGGQGVGLEYSPQLVDGGASCDAGYGGADVEVGLLPDHSAALARSLEARAPEGLSSLLGAFEKAIVHMKTRMPSFAGRSSLVVLMTNGTSNECSPLVISTLVELARSAFETEPKVRTAVIGLGPIDPAFDAVAKAGLTGSAFRISSLSGQADPTSQFFNSMLSATAFQGCTFLLPVDATTTPLNRDLVGVRLTPVSTNISEAIPRVNGASECALNHDVGWYFDAPIAPTQVLLCPGTCDLLASSIADVAYGCTTTRRLQFRGDDAPPWLAAHARRRAQPTNGRHRARLDRSRLRRGGEGG